MKPTRWGNYPVEQTSNIVKFPYYEFLYSNISYIMSKGSPTKIKNAINNRATRLCVDGLSATKQNAPNSMKQRPIDQDDSSTK